MRQLSIFRSSKHWPAGRGANSGSTPSTLPLKTESPSDFVWSTDCRVFSVEVMIPWAESCAVWIWDIRASELSLDSWKERKTWKDGHFSLNGRKEGHFYLTTRSTDFILWLYDIGLWLRTTQRGREETRCCHMGYSFPLTARVLLYAPLQRQDSTAFVTPVVEHWLEWEIAQWRIPWRIDPMSHQEKKPAAATSKDLLYAPSTKTG